MQCLHVDSNCGRFRGTRTAQNDRSFVANCQRNNAWRVLKILLIWYLSHSQATKGPASLRKSADSPEPLLLVCKNVDIDEDTDQISWIPLAPLDTSAWAFK